MNTKVTKRLMLFMFMAMVSVAVLIPVYAHAAYDKPSTEEGDTTTVGNKTSTAVNLQHVDGEVDVTVPTTINLVINNDGTFTTPDADATYIQNLSLVDIYVKNLNVVNYDGTGTKAVNGVEKWSTNIPTEDNSFWVQINASNTGATTTKTHEITNVAVAGDKQLYNKDASPILDLWKLNQAKGQSTKDGGKVTMALSGAMINVTDDLHSALDQVIQLQTYTWTITSAQ